MEEFNFTYAHFPKSSVVMRAYYNANNREALIVLEYGAYIYSDITKNRWERFTNAESAGKAYNDLFKYDPHVDTARPVHPGRILTIRVNEDPKDVSETDDELTIVFRGKTKDLETKDVSVDAALDMMYKAGALLGTEIKVKKVVVEFE